MVVRPLAASLPDINTTNAHPQTHDQHSPSTTTHINQARPDDRAKNHCAAHHAARRDATPCHTSSSWE
jgi:hypothetical protein